MNHETSRRKCQNCPDGWIRTLKGRELAHLCAGTCLHGERDRKDCATCSIKALPFFQPVPRPFPCHLCAMSFLSEGGRSVHIGRTHDRVGTKDRAAYQRDYYQRVLKDKRAERRASL